MLTDEDIQKLLTVLETRFATKQDLKESLDDNIQKSLKVFATKQDFENLATKAEFQDFKNEILTAVDSYAKKADTYFQEMVMLTQKVNLLEKWIHQLADQSGIKLQY